MKKHLKNHKVLYSILGIILLLIIVAIVIVTSPKNLGVRYSKADLNSAVTKVGTTYASTSQGDSLKIAGTRKLDTKLTQSELTALLNQPSDLWKDYPVKDIQLKINDDGSVEMTGKIITGRYNDYVKATNVPSKYTSLVQDKINMVPLNPSFDYKGNYEVQNGKVVGELTSLKVGPVEVPKDWTDNNQNFIAGFVEDRLSSAGLKIDNAKFTDGNLNIQGSAPQTISFGK